MAATCTKKDESPIRASDRTHSPHEDIPFRASSGGDVFVPAASGIRTSAPLDIPRHAVNQAISAVPSALSSLTAWTQARKPVFRPFRSFSVHHGKRTFLRSPADSQDPPFGRHGGRNPPCPVPRLSFHLPRLFSTRSETCIYSICDLQEQDYNKPVTKDFFLL